MPKLSLVKTSSTRHFLARPNCPATRFRRLRASAIPRSSLSNNGQNASVLRVDDPRKNAITGPKTNNLCRNATDNFWLK